MKILQISSAKHYGGGERHFVDLCRGLQEKGHEVFAILRPTCQWQDRLDFLPKENIFAVSIRNSFGIFSSKRIANVIRRKNIEIVHAHVARDYFPVGLACRIVKGPKFVLTRHVLFPMKAFYRFALNNLSKAIAVSRGVEENLQALFPKEKVVIISNGIETKSFSKDDRQKQRDAFRFEHNIPFDAHFIGTLGELKELKGQRDFVLAAKITAEKFPQAYFAIVGKDNSSNQSFRRELKRLVKVFGLTDHFIWLNWVEDTANFLSALDVYVSPSHSESFGLATLEAMADQTPIVATETAGTKELLRNDESGLLVPIKDPVSLAESVNKLLADENMRIKLSENALLRAQEKFSLQKMIDETEKTYQDLI